MKKQEALEISKMRANFILDAIGQILNYSTDVEGHIDLYSVSLEQGSMCGLHILVPETNYERFYNLEIPSRNILTLYDTVLTYIVKNYIFQYKFYSDSDNLGVELTNSLTNNTVKIEFFISNASLEKWKYSILNVLSTDGEEK